VITQSGAAQGLAVLAPLRGAFTSFLCLTDRRGGHILCRPPFARVLQALLADSFCSALRIVCSCPGLARTAAPSPIKKTATFDRDSLYQSDLN